MEQNDEWAVGRRYFIAESMAAPPEPGGLPQLAPPDAVIAAS